MVLTIVIINWNTKEDLLSCLSSIWKERGGVEKEVFVVDNGSKDGSAEAVRKEHPLTKVLENETNWGFARAVNLALRQMKGRYALLLNPDTRLKKESTERLISFMDDHPKVGVVGPQLLNSDGSKQNSIANFPTLATELLNKSLLRWLFPKKFPGKERNYTEPIEVDSVIGACMMVRQETLKQVGLLDENYFLFLEETDWCYRIRAAGWNVYHCPRAEIIHFQGKSAGAEKGRARLEYYRSRYHFFKKNRGNIQWLILLIGGLIRLSFELIFTATACVMTLFTVKKCREKLSVLAYVMWWHLRFCPEGMGLKPMK
jgi:GT2 family glycosyltransferase